MSPDVSEFTAFAAEGLATKYKVAQEQVSWLGQLQDVPLQATMCHHGVPIQRTYGAMLLKTWSDVILEEFYPVGYGENVTVLYLTGQCPQCGRVYFGQLRAFSH